MCDGVGHGGSVPGYLTLAVSSANARRQVVVLVNASPTKDRQAIRIDEALRGAFCRWTNPGCQVHGLQAPRVPAPSQEGRGRDHSGEQEDDDVALGILVTPPSTRRRARPSGS